MLATLLFAALSLRGLCSAVTEPNSTSESAEELALVQVKVDVRGRQPGAQQATKALGKLLYGLTSSLQHWAECQEPHVEDLYRPVKQVLAEHPGIDGNCWFHFYADYLTTPRSHAQYFRETVLQYSRNAGQGVEVTLHLTTGEDLTTHLDGNWGLYPYDDAMCYMMGWMKGQRLDAHVMDLLDDEKWRNVSAAECARLPKMVEGGLDDNGVELTIGYMADDNERICRASECLVEPRDDASCKKATLKDYVYHLYPKCLLDEGLKGASSEVAWCFARACVEGNVIKHGMECWPQGLPF